MGSPAQGRGRQQFISPLAKLSAPASESRAALPRGEAEGGSSSPSLERGGAASLSQVAGVGGWSEGSSSSLSSWISGCGDLVSLLWVSKSLSAASLYMCVKGASAFLAVSLEIANMFERGCVDVPSSTGSEV